MIVIGLIAIFLLVGWFFLALNNLSEYETTTLILSVAAGLSAVVITSSAIVIKKLDSIKKSLEENRNKEKER